MPQRIGSACRRALRHIRYTLMTSNRRNATPRPAQWSRVGKRKNSSHTDDTAGRIKRGFIHTGKHRTHRILRRLNTFGQYVVVIRLVENRCRYIAFRRMPRSRFSDIYSVLGAYVVLIKTSRP